MEGVLASGALESLTKRVREKISYSSSLPVITCAASLVHHGYLGSVQYMWLWDLDLTSLPAKHLASLVSSVTERVGVKNVGSRSLVTILDSVESEWLNIYGQSLGSEETRALVRAMESGVEKVRLIDKVTLEIRSLMEYSGQGECQEVGCYDDTAARYRDKLRRWATSRNWVTNDERNYINISKT